jgi:hypothetical protein
MFREKFYGRFLKSDPYYRCLYSLKTQHPQLLESLREVGCKAGWPARLRLRSRLVLFCGRRSERHNSQSTQTQTEARVEPIKTLIQRGDSVDCEDNEWQGWWHATLHEGEEQLAEIKKGDVIFYVIEVCEEGGKEKQTSPCGCPRHSQPVFFLQVKFTSSATGETKTWQVVSQGIGSPSLSRLR